MCREALVVGINTYDNLHSLKGPAQDAEAIARLLTAYGKFRVHRLPQENNPEADGDKYRIRADGEKSRVPQTALEQSLERLFVPPSSDDLLKTALFYFAGHGLRQPGVNQFSYLATSDSNPKRNSWGVSFHWLRELLNKSSVEEQIIWLDCCYSGDLKKFLEEELQPKVSSQFQRRYVIAACRGYEEAYEEAKGSHGVLTKALLTGLDPNLSETGRVSNDDLTLSIQRQLENVPQKPVFFHTGGEILLTGPGTRQSVGSHGQCPYKGLNFFDYAGDDPRYFYGRTQLTDELLQHVRQSDFLAILGSSGSGKSSVLRAGLIHQIHLGQRQSGTDRWTTYVLRPGTDPLVSLAEAFVPSGLPKIEAASQYQKAKDLIDSGAQGLEALVRATAGDARVILAIDQFEEVFTLCEDQQKRQHFLACLLETLDRVRVNNLLCVVLTMRLDLVKECEKYTDFAKRIADQESHIIVTQMSSAELQEAIVEPAKQLDATVEPELVAQIQADLEGSGSLPLLQYTLTQLWKGRTVNRLTISAYTRLGGVRGALQEQVDKIYKALSPEEQLAAKRIFLELTQLGEGTEDTRRQVLQSKLRTTKQSADLVDRVVSKLVDERLLVKSVMKVRGDGDESEVTVIDVAHEALIRHWSELRQWLDEYRDKIRTERKIEAAADEWQSQGRPNDAAFLWLGPRLVGAKEFLQNDELGLLELLAQEFIQASQTEQERQENKHRLEVEEKAEKQALLNTAMRSLGIAAIVILVSLIVAGFKARDAQIAQQGTRLEQAGVGALRQFKSGELNALIAAMHSAGELQELIRDIHNPEKYPATSPILSLQKILDDIHEQNHFEAGQGEIKSAVFLPGGDRFITAGKGKDQANTLQIWNLAGKLEVSLVGHKGGTLGGVNAVSVGGDTQNPLIASAGEDGTVRLWNQSGQQMGQLVPEGKKNESFGAIAVSPDGQKIIAGQRNGTVYLWERSGKQLKTWVAHENNVTAIAFSRDGQKVATAGEDGLARIWTVAGSKLAELKPVGVKEMYGVSFSPDGQSIAVASDDNRARIWKITGQDVRLLEGHQGLVTVANFSPDGQTIATASDDGSVKLWDARTGQKLQDFRGHRGVVWSASFSPDGKWLASAGRDESVRLWNLGDKPGQQVDLAGFRDDVNALAFSPDGKTIAGAGNEGVMRLWDTSGKEIKVWQEAIYQQKNVQDVAFSPDGTFIVASGLYSIARVWDVAGSAAEPQAKLMGVEGRQEGHQRDIGSVAVSPHSQLIATGSFDKTIRIWKPKSPNGELVAVTPKQEGVVSRVVFTADGQRIVSADWEGNVAFWDLVGHQLGKWQKVHQTQIRGLGITRDGSRIVTADKSGYVKILDGFGKLQKEFFSYQSGINVLTISPDEQMLATGGMDGTARVWDFQGRQLAEFQNPKGSILGLAFSPDSHQITLAGEHGFASVRAIPSLVSLMKQGCGWLQNYLESHPTEKSTLSMCR